MKLNEFYKTEFKLELRDKFLQTLSEAQQLRPKKNKFIDNEIEWVTYEREVMFNMVNTERSELGYFPITLKTFKRAENCAVGHTDYSQKFALYCAELVLDKNAK